MPARRVLVLFCLLAAALARPLLAQAPGAATPAPPPPVAAPATSATPALPAPQWVGVSVEAGKVRLTWIRNAAFAAVRVARRRADGAEGFATLGQSRENTWLDATAQPGVAYVYRLTGVGPDGREGRPSAELSARIAPVVLRPPVPPVWEGYLLLEKGVGLKWSVREGEDILAHNIYRRDLPEGEFQLVGSLRGTSYQDTTTEAGRSYAYAITTLDSSFRETPRSQELQVQVLAAKAPVEKKVEETWRVRRTRLVALVPGGDVPFLRPADVAVGPVSGNVYLADSGLARVFVFTPQGRYLRSLGAAARLEEFRNVLGLAVDRGENLHVADAGRGAVLVFGPQGDLLRRVDVPRQPGGGPTGIIDAAVGPGERLFVVDNLNNRVSSFVRAEAPQPIASGGAGAGEFSAPTFCDVDAAGNLYVADAFNARVQVLDAAGAFVRSFGRYQRGPGGLGRPKGVAVSRTGEVYVADSWFNTVQVFDAAGAFVAVLGDEEGRPLDLGSPNGVALGPGGRVVIAERLASRLQIREVIDEAR